MRIVLVSDTHLTPKDSTFVDNWRRVERWMDTAMPDLVVHLGDITANGVHDAAEFDHAHGILTDGRRSIRFVPGNHDIGDHPAGPCLTPAEPLDPVRLAQYRSVFGPDCWSLRTGGWLVIGLNALVMGTNSKFEAAQHRWLEEMTRSHRGPVGLLLHKPLFQADPEEDIVRERYVPKAARLRLLAALEQSSLRFVAAGHTHQSRQFCHAGIDHVWVPSTAFVVPDALQECIGDKLVGVTMLEIDANGHRFTPVVPAGVKANDLLDYSHVYPRLNAALAHRARDGEPCR